MKFAALIMFASALALAPLSAAAISAKAGDDCAAACCESNETCCATACPCPPATCHAPTISAAALDSQDIRIFAPRCSPRVQNVNATCHTRSDRPPVPPPKS